jgi:hypothetical protein
MTLNLANSIYLYTQNRSKLVERCKKLVIRRNCYNYELTRDYETPYYEIDLIT